MIKVFSLLALCLPLWGQSNTLTFQGTDSTSTGIMKVVEGPVTAEDSAHQAYRLALADFALLITKGPITVDALEAAFEKIDATKMKWVMSKGATVELGSIPKPNGTRWTQGGKEYSSPSYIDSEGNIMRNGMLQGRDLPKPSIDRSDAKSINRVKVKK